MMVYVGLRLRLIEPFLPHIFYFIPNIYIRGCGVYIHQIEITR